MSAQKSILNNLLPDTTAGKIVLLVLVLVAFSLGSFFSGVDSPPSENYDSHAEQVSSDPTTWTCSMHPQIQLHKEGKCPICFMDLIPLENHDDGTIAYNQIKLSEHAKATARIQSSKVTRGYASRIVRMNGKIDFDESRIAYVTARFPGRLDKLFADYTGMHVSKGDQLASIYSPQLLSAQEELIQAVTTVEKLKNSESKILARTADETLDAAREKLRLYDLTNEQINTIEESHINSDHLTIYSPIEGVVVHKNAKEGMYVKTGSKIYTLADLSKLWVYFDAYESDLVWLRIGQQVMFTTTTFASQSFKTTISFIDPVINPKTRTVKVRAEIDNSDNLLKPDMLVHGEVSSKIISKDKMSDEQPLLIPASALLITGKQAVVFVESESDEGSLYEARQIKIGPKAGEFYIVYEGLSEGETIVTNGAFKIDAELQIQAKPSMMSPEGGTAPMVHDHGQMKNAESKTTTDHSEHSAINHSDSLIITEKMQAVLTPLYNSYFELQMALAMDDAESAQKHYNAIAQAHAQINKKEFTGVASDKFSEFSKQIDKYSRLGKTAGDIVTARDLFFNLSKTMIQLEKTFGHADDKNFYLTFCPMTRDNKGAFWLQTVDTVYNSFYGDMMLHCGSIEDTIPSSMGRK